MIDLKTEELVTFSQAAHWLGKKRGCPVSPLSVTRWARYGLKRDGQQIRLESLKIGGRRVTSMEACQRFCDRLTGETDVVTPVTPTDRERLRRAEEAGRELEKLGM